MKVILRQHTQDAPAGPADRATPPPADSTPPRSLRRQCRELGASWPPEDGTTGQNLLEPIAQQRGGVAKPETWGGERSGRPLGGLEGPGESGGSGGVWEARTGGWWGGGWQHNTGGYGKRAGRGVCGNNSARRGQRGRDARGVEAAGQCRVCGAGMGRMARARGAKGVERSSSVPGAAVPAGVERGVGSKRRESSHWIDSEQ